MSVLLISPLIQYYFVTFHHAVGGISRPRSHLLRGWIDFRSIWSLYKLNVNVRIFLRSIWDLSNLDRFRTLFRTKCERKHVLKAIQLSSLPSLRVTQANRA